MTERMYFGTRIVVEAAIEFSKVDKNSTWERSVKGNGHIPTWEELRHGK